MTKQPCLCHTCNGTGEIIEEPGGDGYPTLYADCDTCDGAGYIQKYQLEDVYAEDHLYHVVEL
jgi:DnaJ-class molecular chaperone